MSRERVLVTAAAGFLGSHLCERFLKEGYHVIGMDNLITGGLRNIEHLFPLEHFEFHNHDVSKFHQNLQKLIEIRGCGAQIGTKQK